MTEHPDDDADTLIREWASQLTGPKKPKGVITITFYWLTIIGVVTLAALVVLTGAGLIAHLLYWPFRLGWNLT